MTPVTTSACIVMRWRHTSSITSPLNDEYRPRNLVRPKDDHFLFRAERSGAERSGTAWLPGWPAVAAAIDWHMADEVSVFRIFVCVLWSSWLRPLQHCAASIAKRSTASTHRRISHVVCSGLHRRLPCRSQSVQLSRTGFCWQIFSA